MRCCPAYWAGSTSRSRTGGTDAFRVACELGRLAWERQTALALAGAYAGADEVPAALVHAVSLHAALRGVREVEVSGVTVRAEDLQGAVELWAQWGEWLRGGAPEAFLRWAYRSGTWRPSRLVEPEGRGIPDRETCRSVLRALVEDARQAACYLPWGAFVLAVPDDLFLHGWGVRELWLWVEGDRMWCAVAGEDGVPRESFLWSADEGVETTLVVPPGAREAIGAVLAAVWRDMAVAGEEAMPRRERRSAVPPAASGAFRAHGGAGVAVFPRRSMRRLDLSGARWWGREEDRRAVRRAHAVRGHVRRLPVQRRPSDAARRAAGQWGIVLPAGCTFVRPHVRGKGRGEAAEPEARKVAARGLATVAALLA